MGFTSVMVGDLRVKGVGSHFHFSTGISGLFTREAA